MENKQWSETVKSDKKISDLLLRRLYSFMLEYGSISIIKRLVNQSQGEVKQIRSSICSYKELHTF
ncbi:unnamed protein product [Acanthoscelides obtectus]|uniref:Uncharacterized protein n=1 Tax=Acanthoscelides obtectus TaxID=200917 RepID=A0A9P0MHL1_ACAOB|nr:unnamed protein product [Acanthoscelides obtectus]CAK1632895.1 hypothetical protein AOBTE_LOCUS7799 [Acanthoscelides obtectus]